METSIPKSTKQQSGLSSEKREDIWALIIAGVVLLISLISPEGVYQLFKKALYLF